MGNITFFGGSLNSLSVFYLSAQLSPLAGGLALGLIFILLIIIAGFIFYKMLQKDNYGVDEDRNLSNNKGFVRKRNDL